MKTTLTPKEYAQLLTPIVAALVTNPKFPPGPGDISTFVDKAESILAEVLKRSSIRGLESES